MEVVRALREAEKEEDVPGFRFIEINAMRLTEPNQAYVQLWKQLSRSDERITPDHALSLLNKRFNGCGNGQEQTSIVLVDELDMLCNRRQSVLYNLFEWPTRTDSRLVILAIANAMDLPERVMMNR